ncbi:MAG TPA: GNAT family N-acetyltransferase [Thermoplasmatales archaeon]|nr:GNAT family N-acetyltransferase [Thermoplasmatales archaeon]
MLIRLAELKDTEKIAKNNVMLAEESENIEICYERAVEGVEKVIEDINKGFYLIAEENGEIIGQIMITYEWSDWKARQIWWLQSIYVKKKHRRKGIMKLLINEIIKMALENNVILLRLYVHENNKNAMNAYEKIDLKRTPYFIYEMKVQ